MGCSQSHGPLFVIDGITTPNIYMYQNGTLVLGTHHMETTAAIVVII